jgi:formamidopyrimidine-DNA glycosylase
MPELPEVETIVRTLKPDLVGRTVLKAYLRWARTLARPSARKFRGLVPGLKIRNVARRAKFLVIEFATRPGRKPYNLIIHLRMSGDLLLKKGKIKPEKHDRLLLVLTGQRTLAFNDTRKFGRAWFTDDPEIVLGGLGPEPLNDGFSVQWLFDNLRTRKRQLKPLLLDQTFLAGLGNIYTDECLHMARLHPLTPSNSITLKQAQALHTAIRAVLEEGIRRNGASIDWVYRGGDYQNHFRVYDRTGEPCPACDTPIQRLVVGQRGTHICPNCQRLR